MDRDKKGQFSPTIFYDRFWSKVKKTDYCWNWTASLDKDGYGIFRYNKEKQGRAHIASWFIFTGFWPIQQVLHKCDNPKCVRPDHLFEGTQKDNVQDAIKKGRNHPWENSPLTKKGTKAPNRKTTFDIAQKIREEYLTKKINQRELAKKYGLSYQVIFGIVNNKIYLN